jgi:hypothetical protein
MATQNLSVTDPTQVSSPKMLEVFVGSPPQRMLVFTGIAIPDWDSNGDLDAESVIVDLNAESNEPNPQFAATVGLASIYNEDSDLVFATDDVAIFTAPKATPSGTKLGLFLGCNIAVLGERSVLSRFSYQATVLLNTDRAQIAGTIRWDPNLMTHNAAMEQDLFDIQAFIVTIGPGAPGGFGTTTTTVEKIGKTSGKPDWIGSQLGIAYEIDEPPLGESLFVAVIPKPGAFVVHSTATFNFVQVSGPSPIVLSISHLVEKPVDFEPRQFQQPH